MKISVTGVVSLLCSSCSIKGLTEFLFCNKGNNSTNLENVLVRGYCSVTKHTIWEAKLYKHQQEKWQKDTHTLLLLVLKKLGLSCCKKFSWTFDTMKISICSCSFFLSFFFSVTHTCVTHKTIQCMQIFNIPNICSVMELIFTCSELCELWLARYSLKTVSKRWSVVSQTLLWILTQ